MTLYCAAEIFAALPDAYLILNADHEVVLANARYLALVAQPLSAIEGKRVYDINQFGSVQQRSERVAWLETSLKGLLPGEPRTSLPFRYEMPALASGDKNVWTARYWTIKATAINLDQSGRSCIAVSVADVTQEFVVIDEANREKAKLRSQARLRQVLAEEAHQNLLENQAKLRLALDFAEIGAWEVDRATGRMECTAQTLSLFGLDGDQEITAAQLYDQLIDIEDRQHVLATVNDALGRHEHFQVEHRCTWPDGSRHWLLVKGMGRFANGDLHSVLGFSMDITKRKESELKQLNIAASERHAREQSDAAAQSMDHFVTSVSHELRSPLGAILSWTALMQRSIDLSHAARAADVIERNARQLSHMVDDLLDSGAIVTGKLTVDMRPTDFAALTGNVVEDVRLNAQAKGLVVLCSELEPSMVMADESRLMQVVWNLLSNAMKFCVEGEIEVSVKHDNARVVLAVRDTGCGIEASAIDKIFQRFEQSKTVLPGRVGGLGLGLWLVKNIVELHHGDVTVASDGLGQGTTFRVSLPTYV